jgi:hypothetical protein
MYRRQSLRLVATAHHRLALFDALYEVPSVFRLPTGVLHAASLSRLCSLIQRSKYWIGER